MTTFEKIVAILAEDLEIEAGKIQLESTFVDLGLDSLDTVEMIMKLEDEFAISIDVDPSIKSVADLVQVIDGEKNK